MDVKGARIAVIVMCWHMRWHLMAESLKFNWVVDRELGIMDWWLIWSGIGSLNRLRVRVNLDQINNFPTSADQHWLQGQDYRLVLCLYSGYQILGASLGDRCHCTAWILRRAIIFSLSLILLNAGGLRVILSSSYGPISGNVKQLRVKLSSQVEIQMTVVIRNISPEPWTTMMRSSL